MKSLCHESWTEDSGDVEYCVEKNVVPQRQFTLPENNELARQINAEARSNPASPYVGKYVGIANGQVVVVAESWREVPSRLREVEPDPAKCQCIEASADYDAVHEMFSVN